MNDNSAPNEIFSVSVAASERVTISRSQNVQPFSALKARKRENLMKRQNLKKKKNVIWRPKHVSVVFSVQHFHPRFSLLPESRELFSKEATFRAGLNARSVIMKVTVRNN